MHTQFVSSLQREQRSTWIIKPSNLDDKPDGSLRETVTSAVHLIYPAYPHRSLWLFLHLGFLYTFYSPWSPFMLFLRTSPFFGLTHHKKVEFKVEWWYLLFFQLDRLKLGQTTLYVMLALFNTPYSWGVQSVKLTLFFRASRDSNSRRDSLIWMCLGTSGITKVRMNLEAKRKCCNNNSRQRNNREVWGDFRTCNRKSRHVLWCYIVLR